MEGKPKLYRRTKGDRMYGQWTLTIRNVKGSPTAKEKGNQMETWI